jgi:DNA-binding transcriptional regulator YdaS (Cro superfamily)
MTALEKAVEHCGGALALADKAGVSKATVYFWLSGKRNVGAKSAKRIEQATNGAVSCAELCPDVFGEAPQAA